MLRYDALGYMPELETGRLILRKLTMHDAEDIYAYSRDPEVARHVLWDAHRSIGESRTYLRFMLRKYRMNEAASWGIELKETGRIIGTIGFMWVQDDNRAAEVGYSLARAQWGKGIMTEALAAVIEYGFLTLRLNRIEAIHELSNPASGAVMRRCGMIREGTMREKLFNKGKYVDVDLYAILRKDFSLRGAQNHV
ncbi:MAG: GNAT family N-acetyltransferase [Candidatus Faecivicinus sp.]|nr:GNAT family N-acetyltransferase [Candidatus Faecivicinus sp.]